MSKLEKTFETSSSSSRASTRRSRRPASSPSTLTEFFGTMASSAESTRSPAARSASCTAWNAAGDVVTTYWSPSRAKSSAPASSACSSVESSDELAASSMTWPRWSNIHATDPVAPRLPPLRLKAWRISATVRVGLSVVASMKMAAPPGP